MVALNAEFLQSLPSHVLHGRNPLNQEIRDVGGIPVAPGAFPGVGHLPALMLDPLTFYRESERRVGPVFRVESGFGMKAVCYARPESFTLFKNKVTTSEYMLKDARSLEFVGGSLLGRDGAAHQHMRSAMNGPFQPRGLGEAGVGAVSGRVIEDRVRGLLGKRGIRALAETRELALDVIFRIVGIGDHDLSEWRRRYERLSLLAINIPFDLPGSPRRLGREAAQWLDAELLKVISAARARGDEVGLLPSLLRAKDEEGHSLSDRELAENLRLLLLAGHETSASTMAWITMVMAQRPDVWTKLRDEARSAADLPRSPKELKAFPYAEAVFRETLRMYPPVIADARASLIDMELSGVKVPKDTVITIPILHLSRHADLYEAPDEFRPERWIGRTEGVTPIELVQFGGGPHFCLGYHLAWMEIVQFAVALGRMLPASGPRLDGPPPKARYLPFLHPSASTRVRFD